MLQFIQMRFKRVTTSLIARQEAFREYRKRNLVFWSLFLGFIPVVVFLAVPLGRRLNSEGVAQIVSAVWFMVVVAAGIWRLNWECPRCGKNFYRKWWYKNAFAMRCVNCGYRPGE
jgi:predicted ABC-type exoprotein transport system permease subunit